MSFFKDLFQGNNKHYSKQLIKKSSSKQAILIKEVSIFNGKDKEISAPQDVLLEQGIIKKIGSNLKVADERTYKIIDGSNKTLMPGLVDAHVHISGSGAVPWKNIAANEAYNLSAYLYSGITTVYDLGGIASKLHKLAKQVEDGTVLGPSFYHCHIPMTIKNSHPIPLTQEMLFWPLSALINQVAPTIDAIEKAPKVIAKYLKQKGVSYVKLTSDQIPVGSPEMSFEQIQALTEEAHKKNRKVFIHIGSPENAVNAAQAGVDIIAHGVWRGKLTEAQADQIAACKIPVIYTLAGFQNVAQIYEGKYIPNELDRLLVPNAILDPVSAQKGLDVKKKEVMGAFFETVHTNRPYWRNNFQLLKDRGVRIIVGTDSSLPGTYAGASYFQEIDALKDFGLSNFEILSGATYYSSKLFLENPDFGLVEEGKKANLLLLNGNPLLDLELVKQPEMILLKGDIIERLV